MSFTYQYRLKTTSWGIAIDLTAQALKNIDITNSIKVTDWLFLKIDVEYLLNHQKDFIERGLRSVVSYLPETSNRSLDTLTVCVTDVRFRLTDFQDEGLYCAIRGWGEHHFGISLPKVEVTFDKSANRYQFVLE